MEVFLTSSPNVEGKALLSEANGFAREIRRAIRPGARMVVVSSAPDDKPFNDYLLPSIRECFENSGVTIASCVCLDRKMARQASELVRNSNFLLLAGGHVPTQNRFFHEIRLRELIQGWDGVVVGCSAGSMNAADPVFVQPEEPGEGNDPDFPVFLEGLGLSRQNIVPHYQKVKDYMLDGFRLFEDLIYKKSFGHPLWAIPDGTYIHSVDGRGEQLRGEASLILDGVLTRIQGEGDVLDIDSPGPWNK